MILPLANKSAELPEQLFKIFDETKNEVALLAGQATENSVNSVHLIRKRLKFLRAFVKLTQFISEKNNFNEINVLFRDSGKIVSDCRDAHVRNLLLCEFLQNRHGSSPMIDMFLDINTDQIVKEETTLFSGKNMLGHISGNLTKKPITDYFSTLEGDFDTLLSGYVLSYQKSYEAFQLELKSSRADLLHEWRKRTKDLQYQQEILMQTVPGNLSPSHTELSELCDTLGRINDLHMLDDWMSGLKIRAVHSASFSAFSKELKQEITVLKNETDARGDALYNLTPEGYSDKIEAFTQ